MTKTELINKWGIVGGRVQFDHTKEFARDLDGYLEESRLAENLVSQAVPQAVPEPNASCENCRHIFQEDDNDRKDGCGVCLFLSGEEYIKENKIKTDTKPSRNMGAQGVGEDGFAYGYFYINDITDFSCRHFEQK